MSGPRSFAQRQSAHRQFGPRCSSIFCRLAGLIVNPLPVLDPDQDEIDPLAVLSQQAARIE